MKTLLQQRLERMIAVAESGLPVAPELKMMMTAPEPEYISSVLNGQVKNALMSAYRKHPLNMATLADGIEVTREEFDEFVAEARKQEINADDLLKENLHLVAMSLRLLIDVTIPMWARAALDEQ